MQIHSFVFLCSIHLCDLGCLFLVYVNIAHNVQFQMSSGLRNIYTPEKALFWACLWGFFTDGYHVSLNSKLRKPRPQCGQAAFNYLDPQRGQRQNPIFFHFPFSILGNQDIILFPCMSVINTFPYFAIILWHFYLIMGVTCHGECVEVRGQFVEASSLLLPCGYQGISSRCQAWQKAPLPTELSHQPSFLGSKHTQVSPSQSSQAIVLGPIVMTSAFLVLKISHWSLNYDNLVCQFPNKFPPL